MSLSFEVASISVGGEAVCGTNTMDLCISVRGRQVNAVCNDHVFQNSKLLMPGRH